MNGAQEIPREPKGSRPPVHRVDEPEGATLRERRNWRIFATFARQEYPECLQIIEEQLCACHGLAEYPIYVKGGVGVYPRKILVI